VLTGIGGVEMGSTIVRLRIASFFMDRLVMRTLSLLEILQRVLRDLNWERYHMVERESMIVLCLEVSFVRVEGSLTDRNSARYCVYFRRWPV